MDFSLWLRKQAHSVMTPVVEMNEWRPPKIKAAFCGEAENTDMYYVYCLYSNSGKFPS